MIDAGARPPEINVPETDRSSKRAFPAIPPLPWEKVKRMAKSGLFAARVMPVRSILRC